MTASLTGTSSLLSLEIGRKNWAMALLKCGSLVGMCCGQGSLLSDLKPSPIDKFLNKKSELSIK